MPPGPGGLGLTSDDGYERLLKQMEEDGGGLSQYAIAMFGKPGKGAFEFVLTGRHLTLRADGDTLPGMAFGGPLVYGHSVDGNSPKNLFFYQTQRANQMFQALDGKQQKKALLTKAPKETAVQIRESGFPGLAGSELSDDQLELLEGVLKDVLKPYRGEDVEEVFKMIGAAGGLKKVHSAFYSSNDLGNDKVWDIWRLEGPSMVCHFRGAPHVHAYINVAKKNA